MSFAKTLRRVWHFLWEEDSLLSWLVNIVLAFIIVKFIVYPGLGLLLGTGYPVVAVISASMEHRGSFDSWWVNGRDWYEKNNITYDEFGNFEFRNGFDTGDVMLLIGAKPENIQVGEIIVYSSDRGIPPIIHRVVSKEKISNKYYFITKGDNYATNQVPDHLPVPEDRVLGRAVFRIPLLGWVKIWFTDAVSLVRGG
jgi:signal peptidase I